MGTNFLYLGSDVSVLILPQFLYLLFFRIISMLRHHPLMIIWKPWTTSKYVDLLIYNFSLDQISSKGHYNTAGKVHINVSFIPGCMYATYSR